MRRTLLAVLVMFVVVVGALGCESPERGFERFYAGMVDQDAAAVRDALSAKSRAAVDVTALTAKAPASTVRAIHVVERQGDERATLEVVDVLGAKERVVVVKEDGKWRVDLMASATTAPESKPSATGAP